MLEEDRATVLDGGNLGSRVVGGTLQQIEGAGARELFAAMATAPEGVPMPMAALELVWCSKKGLAPPLKRLAMMRPRKHTLALLDRGLVLGETTPGVYMHDVVREYSQALVGAEPPRQHHRALVKLLLAAAPARGRLWVRREQLGGYVTRGLRHHFKGALHEDVVNDTEAVGWLGSAEDGFVLHNFVVREAANAIGARSLTTVAEGTHAAGNFGRSGPLFVCCSAVGGTPHVAGGGAAWGGRQHRAHGARKPGAPGAGAV